MLPLGTTAPDFELLNVVKNEKQALSALKGSRGTMIMFICNHCPFVMHVNAKIAELGRTYPDKGIGFIAISSNDVENYPQDRPELMAELVKQEGFEFPYLYDETQSVAQAYDAACTPDFYLIDAELKLVYRGQLDDSRPQNGKPISGKDLTDAMDALLDGQPISDLQKPSLGCNIKWKPQ
jgi:thiol-disulfide isomerase/thioredoxin